MDSSKPDGQYKKTASNEKLIKLVPDFKFTPFEEGEFVPLSRYGMSLLIVSVCRPARKRSLVLTQLRKSADRRKALTNVFQVALKPCLRHVIVHLIACGLPHAAIAICFVQLPKSMYTGY